MMSRLSITSRTFIIMCSVSVALALIGIGGFWQTAYNYKRDDLAVRIATASVRLSRAILPAVSENDQKTIEAVLAAFAGTPEVSCVVLTSRSQDTSIYWPSETCVADNPDSLLHVQPIRRSVRVLGEVEVYFTHDMILAELFLVVRVIAAGLIGILIGALAVLWLAQRRIILRPVEQIIQAIDNIKIDDLSTRVGDLQAAPELQEIADAFDKMTGTLEGATMVITRQSLELREKHDIISQSLDYGSAVQGRLISLDPISGGQFEIDGFVEQLSRVGGDFHIGIDQNERYVLFFADATGHGIPGALATVVLSMAVRNALAFNPLTSPDVIFADVHRRIITGLKDRRAEETDVKLGADAALLVLEKASGRIQWCSAKQPFFLAFGGEVGLSAYDQQSLGYETAPKTFTVFDGHFGNSGDTLVFCSDGILDAPGGAKGFGFGKTRVKRIIKEGVIAGATASEIVSAIRNETRSYMGQREALDDMSCVAVRLTATL